jgi:hypothetical protein
MPKREIIDCVGKATGAVIERYAWRSGATQSPFTGQPVRAIVAQDERGQYWGGVRIGPGNGAKQQNEFWTEPFQHKEDGIKVARELTRSFLSKDAEQQADRMPKAYDGRELVRVKMDDG